jgi:hypothetical protein
MARETPFDHQPAGSPAVEFGISVQGAGELTERGQGTRTIIEAAVNRLADLLDEETAALRNHAPIDLKAANDRKSLGLMELNRVLRLLGNAKPERSTVQSLERLNEKLAANRHFLGLHVDAVREVAAIISQTIREADSDGTYSPAFRSKG